MHSEHQARRTAERRMEREIRRKAKQEAALARSFRVNPVNPPRATRSPYEAWLDERDARRPLLREDLHTQSDKLAAGAVENGCGIDAVIEATGLRTLENVVRNIDPAILVRAYDYDAVARAFAPPDRARLRRLSPDATLMQRRATGEPLRRLARDYGVSHSTLSRWLTRPTVARQLRELQRLRRVGKLVRGPRSAKS
jgi:transposase-like protein